MRYLIILLIFLLIPLVQADTTFFDSNNNIFIMGSSPTGGVIIEEPTGGTTDGETPRGGGCLYKWGCTSWGECLPSGKQTRNCTNIGTCPNTYKTPEIEQGCTYTQPLESQTPEFEKEEIGEEEEIVNNKILIYTITGLVILSIILYSKRNYLKKLIKKRK